jgi:hypothetical protein
VINADTAIARNLTMRIAAFLMAEIEAGADASLLAMAALGTGCDLLARTQGAGTTIQALHRLADDILVLDAGAVSSEPPRPDGTRH